jgi:hypothetical protein
MGLLSRGGVNFSAVFSCEFSSVILHCSVSFMSSFIILSTELLFYVVLRCSVLLYIVLCCHIFCFYLCCCLVICYFHCVMLLSTALWIGLYVFDKLTVHQKSHRWTKFRKLHIMKEIHDTNQDVALTERDKYIFCCKDRAFWNEIV